MNDLDFEDVKIQKIVIPKNIISMVFQYSCNNVITFVYIYAMVKNLLSSEQQTFHHNTKYSIHVFSFLNTLLQHLLLKVSHDVLWILNL